MTEVHCICSMIMNVKKDTFLSNMKNKQAFINLLGCVLEQTRHATGDADVLIIQTTSQSALSDNTVLVDDDTDLVILLCNQVPADSSHKGLKPNRETQVTKVLEYKAHKVDSGSTCLC